MEQFSSVLGQANSPDTKDQVVYCLVAQESSSGVGEVSLFDLFKYHPDGCQPDRSPKHSDGAGGISALDKHSGALCDLFVSTTLNILT